MPAMGHGEGRRPVGHELESTRSLEGGGGAVATVLIESGDKQREDLKRLPFFKEYV